MKFFNRLFLFLFLFITTFFVAGTAFSQTEFIENKGQWDKQVKYMSNAGNGAFFLQNNGFTVLQHNAEELAEIQDKHHHNKDEYKVTSEKILHSHAYKVEFINANEHAEIIPDKASPSVNNYFIGNDKSKWASDCKIYGAVTYKNIYPNIDIRYYADAASNLKYDFIVHPGGNINNIALRYNGANDLLIKNKELIIKTSIGENKELYPYSYQVIDNEKKELDAKYIIDGNVVRFKVKDYSSKSTLIIDPTLIFFSYTGSKADNFGFTATYGPDGSFYSGGIVYGTGFPVSLGAYQTSFSGGKFDIGIMKLTPDGTNRVYATYIGGSGEDQPHSLIVDPQGNLILAGRTNSSNYPTTAPTFGKGGAFDIVVTKLNASGSALIGSMRIGGTGDDGLNITTNESPNSLKINYGDDARSEVILDASNNIYVASSTRSTDFLTTPNAFQTKFGGGSQDAVVLKLNPNCNAVTWSTHLGGNGTDAAYVLALDNANNLYVAGGTEVYKINNTFTNDFPGISANALRPAFAGGVDGFVVELSNDGSTVLRGTYIGTSSTDQVYGVQTDKSGNVYVMGTTQGNWPVINAKIYGPSNGKQFISKLKPDLTTYIYSTTFGTGSIYPNISPTAFLVDRCENVYVSGWGGKADIELGFDNSGTLGLPVTSNAIKKVSDPSGSDFYFIVIKKDADSLLYGTFFGEDNPVSNTNPPNFGDHVDGGTSRFDKSGVIYQAMCANCYRGLSFPNTFGSWSNNQGQTGSKCNLGMLKIRMDFAGVAAGPQASINGVVNDTADCVPVTVNFTDTIQNAQTYVWDFGDGSPKVTVTPPNFNVNHTYTAVGFYTVTLIAIDPKACNIADTGYIHIKVGDNRANLDFVANKVPPCTNLTYTFDNTSTATRGTFKTNSFTWDFGDGTPKIVAGSNSVSHTYAGPGTYIVKLILTDTTYCNAPDTLKKTIRISPLVKAQFTTPDKGCAPYNAVFNNTSLGGLNFFWDFDDGSTSTADNPTHLYTLPGNYTIKLYAFDSTSCNKIDSAQFTISVSPVPTAAFTYSPNPPAENTAIQFTNQSLNATNYFWRFGDGDTSILANPSHLFIATGKYNVCLTAINNAGCTDTICASVSALIVPLLDVPSAFTPGKFGINSVIKVQGFGIKEMMWRIYNRWGEKVFESQTQSSGWDGYYKGKLQSMDVYAYTLDVVFSDGTKIKKVGDITLIK